MRFWESHWSSVTRDLIPVQDVVLTAKLTPASVIEMIANVFASVPAFAS